MAEMDDGQPKSTGPRIRDFGMTNQLLTSIHDRLGEVVAAVVATIPESKPVRLEPLRRPETAADRLSRRVANASADYILDQIEEARAREAKELGDG